MDKRFAVLVLCPACHFGLIHGGREHWPKARQLAVLKRSRFQDYSLEKYLAEFHPNAPRAITEDDVDKWIPIGG